MFAVAVSESDLRTWAPVASAGLAAVATVASIFGILLTRRQWLVSKRPDLIGQATKDGYGRVRLEIRNRGAGGAYRVRFYLEIGSEYVTGYAGAGMGGHLGTQDLVTINTAAQPAPATTSVRGVVTYRDTVGRHWCAVSGDHPKLRWGLRRRHKRQPDAQFRLRRWWWSNEDPTDPEQVFHRVFRDAASIERKKVDGTIAV